MTYMESGVTTLHEFSQRWMIPGIPMNHLSDPEHLSSWFEILINVRDDDAMVLNTACTTPIVMNE